MLLMSKRLVCVGIPLFIEVIYEVQSTTQHPIERTLKIFKVY